MNTYKIYSKAGADYGLWSADSEADALVLMHRDAGYEGVRVEDGRIVFDHPEDAEICGQVEDWEIEEVEVSDEDIEALGDSHGFLEPTLRRRRS